MIDDMAPASGRMLREDGTVVNIADWFTRASIARMTASPTQPGDPATGDFWVDTDNGNLYYYNGTAWAQIQTV